MVFVFLGDDAWDHWDSATGVRVSILTCLLAGAAALWAFPARREGLCFQVLRPREFRV